MKVKSMSIIFIFFLLVLGITNTTNAAIEEEAYSVLGKVIYDILPGTTVNDFKTNMKLDETDKIINESGAQNSNTKISTGMQLETANGERYFLSVKGDISGDGNVMPSDLLQLKKVIVGSQTEKQYDVYSLDINNDNDITSTDLLILDQYIIESIDSIIYAKRIIIPESLKIEQNEKMTIATKVIPITASRKFEWESSNPGIISVNENGYIESHNLGNAIITVKSETDLKSTCNVICGVKPTELRLNNTEITMSREGTSQKPREFQIVPTVVPENANIENEITYSSSDTNVATVSESGLITAVNSGTARITATTANNKTAYIDVTIKSDIKDFTITLTADGYTYTDYLQENTIYIAFPNKSGSKWNDGSRKKPYSLQINIQTDTGEEPANVTYTPGNSNITVSNNGLITSTANPPQDMTTSTRQASSSLTINCEGITKNYNIVIFCASNKLKREGEAGVSCDNGGWQSGTTNKGSGHFQRCATCGQCHRFHAAGVDVVSSQDGTHTVQCNLCGGWVHPG